MCRYMSICKIMFWLVWSRSHPDVACWPPPSIALGEGKMSQITSYGAAVSTNKTTSLVLCHIRGQMKIWILLPAAGCRSLVEEEVEPQLRINQAANQIWIGLLQSTDTEGGWVGGWRGGCMFSDKVNDTICLLGILTLVLLHNNNTWGVKIYDIDDCYIPYWENGPKDSIRTVFCPKPWIEGYWQRILGSDLMRNKTFTPRFTWYLLLLHFGVLWLLFFQADWDTLNF